MSAHETLYRWRWLLSLTAVAAIALVAHAGFARLGTFSTQVDSLQDTPPEVAKSKLFDARYDIWFDPEDPGLLLYKQIEDQFSAEDFVLVAFEEPDHHLGVFAPDSLAVVDELTRRLAAAGEQGRDDNASVDAPTETKDANMVPLLLEGSGGQKRRISFDPDTYWLARQRHLHQRLKDETEAKVTMMADGHRGKLKRNQKSLTPARSLKPKQTQQQLPTTSDSIPTPCNTMFVKTNTI